MLGIPLADRAEQPSLVGESGQHQIEPVDDLRSCAVTSTAIMHMYYIKMAVVS